MEALTRFDNKTAVGVLARAALALEDWGNPAAAPILDGEEKIRALLIEEARQKLGLEKRNNSLEAISKLSDFLDEETERLVDKPDIDGAVKRMVSTGELPSDLYDVQIIKNIANFFGKNFERERALISRTVRECQLQQHFGPPGISGSPHLISLFARRFTTPYPFKNFTMLVAGHRGEGKVLHVHHAWRLYDSVVNTVAPADLVELLKRFADVYGYDVTVDGEKGHFFLLGPRVQSRQVRLDSKGKEVEILLTQFAQSNPMTKAQYSALITAINLNQYRETLNKYDTTEVW